jgi:hypothetical protein
MNENPAQPYGNDSTGPENAKRQYWIDADGNVHGVVITMEVDHFFEFTDQAVDLTPRAKDSEPPSA